MLKRLVHFLLKALAVLLALALIAAIVVQIILWTNLPGEWVLSALSKRTGMEISAERFRTGWGGTTEIAGLTVRLPLEDKPFAAAETLTLDHNSLLGLAVGNRFQLDSIAARSAQIRVIQDASGRWNVQGLTQLGSGEQKSRPAFRLPDVQATNVSVYVRDRQGREMRVDPVRFEATSGDLHWAFQAGAPPSLAVKGRIGTGAPYAQQVQISLDGTKAFESTMLPEWLKDPQIDAAWDGYLSGGQLAGRLHIQQGRLRQTRFAGTATVQAGDEAIVAKISEMDVQPDGAKDMTLRIAGGRIRYESFSRQTVLQDVTVQAGPVVFNGGALWDMQAARIATEGRWVSTAPGNGLRSEGTWSGDAQIADPGLKHVIFHLDGQYQDGGNRLLAEFAVEGAGRAWAESNWIIQFPQLAWKGEHAEVTPGAGRAVIAVDWPVVELREVSFAHVQSLQASGFYAADTQKWNIDVQAEGIGTGGEPVDLTFRAEGSAQQAVLSQASVIKGDFQAEASAAVDLPGGRISEGAVSLSGRLPDNAANDFLSRFSGNPWQLQAAVEGGIRPLNLNLDGLLRAEIPRTQVIAENVLSIPFKLRADGSDLTLETASYISENGSWDFSGYYHLEDRNGRLFINLAEIPLGLLSEMSGGWSYEGTLSGKLTADFPRPELSALDLNGSWSVQDFRADSFAAEQVRGDIHMTSGLAELRNILAQRGQGRLTGSGRINLNASRQASFEFAADDWVYPADPSPVSMTADANVTVDVDLRANRVVGYGQLTGDIDVLSRDAGTVKVTANLDDKMLGVSALEGRLLGGDLSGTVHIPLQNWTDSRADVEFAGIVLDRLPDWQENLQGIGGRLSGQVVVRETAEANPLEPLTVSIYTQLQDGRFKEAQIGDFRLTAYAGPERVLVTETVLEIFSGVIQAQGRWTMHDRAYMHLKTSFSNIDVNQILKAVNPEANPVEGTFDGSATLLSTSSLNGLSGRIEGRLSNSNLINNTIIGSIYKSLVIGAKPSKPQGRGTIELHPRGARLEIDSFYYFNEGIEIRGSGVIEDIEKGMQSPVSGLVFGTTRPLGNIDLPGVKELDDLMGVLLLGSVAVKVSGTLEEVKTEVVPVPEVTDAIRSLIWSQRQQGR